MKQFVMVCASFIFMAGLTLSSLAAREVVEGSVEKIDAMKGTVTVKSAVGSRDFTIRTPEKLKDIKVGDKISITIKEDGSMVLEARPGGKPEGPGP